MSKPKYPLYAVIKDDIVVNCGWMMGENVIAANDYSKTYLKEDGFKFVEVNEENNFFYIGMEYKE